MTDEESERTAELFLSLEGSHSLLIVEHDMKFIHVRRLAHPAQRLARGERRRGDGADMAAEGARARMSI